MLKAHGYRIRVLNLVEMEQSNGYNPFRYIRSETDIVKLVTNLINTSVAPAQRQAIAKSFAQALQSSVSDDQAH